MGCSDETAKLTSLCGDIETNLLNDKNTNQNYSTNKIRLPRNCLCNCTISTITLGTVNQQNIKQNQIYNEQILYSDCHVEFVDGESKKTGDNNCTGGNGDCGCNDKAIEINDETFESINCHNILKGIAITNDCNTFGIDDNGDYKGNCNDNSNNLTEQEETICVKFMENINDCKTNISVATKTPTVKTTTIIKTKKIQSAAINWGNKVQQDKRYDKVFFKQFYPLDCHNTIDYCMQQQQQQQQQIVLKASNYNSNNRRFLTYSKTNSNDNEDNTSDCHYCHTPRKLKQLLPAYKCHHRYYRNYHNNHHNCESHVHSAQSQTLQHYPYQKKTYKKYSTAAAAATAATTTANNNNREDTQKGSRTEQRKDFTILSTSLAPLSSVDRRKNIHNANKYNNNCPQQSLLHAYNHMFTNALHIQTNIAKVLHSKHRHITPTSDYVDVIQKEHKLHYYSYHLEKRLTKQQTQYDCNDHCLSYSVHHNIHNSNKYRFDINNRNNSTRSTTINDAITKANTTETTAAAITCKNSSTLNRYSNFNSNSNSNITSSTPASVTQRSTTIFSTTFFSSVLNYIRHGYYCRLRNSNNSINLYAASAILLILFYLATATTVSAITTKKSETSSIDKHPVMLIDWSKFDESSSDKEILDLLLEKKRYDKRLLPPVNDEDFCCGMSSPEMVIKENARRPHHRGTLTVNVNVLLLSLASPDESSLKYEVEFLLNQQWNDPRLEYGNKSHYDFLNALHHHESIWTPDTYFIMHGDFKDPIIPMHFALRIYRNGTITYAMRRHLILSCQGSLHIFPFDDPKCSFSMESISYEESQIKYVWKNDEDTLRKSPSLTTLNAYLIRNKTTPCDQNSWRGNYSCLRVDLIFTRDRAFYFTTVFIPGIILVTSSFITFWLEWNAVPARSMIGNYSCLQVELTFTRDRAYYFTSVFIPGIILVTSSFITFWLEWNAVPARVMIGVTTMLNFFTTSNGFRSTLPVVSNLTAMNVWDGVCMCFIYASLLEFVCVNYMGRKRPQHNAVYRPGENPVTQRLPAVLSRIGVILASPLVVIEREFNAALHSQREMAKLTALGDVPPTTLTEGQTEHKTTHRLLRQDSNNDIINSAVQCIRDRTTVIATPTRERQSRKDQGSERTYYEPDVNIVVIDKDDKSVEETVKQVTTSPSTSEQARQLKRLHSMSTNTPPLIFRSDLKKSDIEMAERQMVMAPLKPPRKKTSRSTSPSIFYETQQGISSISTSSQTPLHSTREQTGEKKRDTGGPNEIVACTTCGGSSSSPCTHSANNGCATETCFVQVRKKEPPHPIRIAKTIDVIARITFPTAYAIFLIFFFVHYKGFS